MNKEIQKNSYHNDLYFDLQAPEIKNIEGLNFFTMHQLDLTILEELGLKRYCSMSYIRYMYLEEYSESTIQRRIKKLLSDKLVGREYTIDPLTRKKEHIYFLKNKGRELLLQISSKFVLPNDVDIPSGHSAIVHDTAVTWFGGLLKRDVLIYSQRGLLNHFEYEQRRSVIIQQYSKEQFIPDAIITLQWQYGEYKTFFCELDNGTESGKQLRQKFNEYAEYFNKRNGKEYLLVIPVKHSHKRRDLLLSAAKRYLKNTKNVFSATLPEIQKFTLFANIWTKPFLKKLKRGVCDRYFLPLK